MITKAYLCFRGTWECVPPGFQYKTTIGRVTGCIWSHGPDIWFGQLYSCITTIYRFKTRGDAEMYVKAANEESRLEAASMGEESVCKAIEDVE